MSLRPALNWFTRQYVANFDGDLADAYDHLIGNDAGVQARQQDAKRAAFAGVGEVLGG